MNTPIYEALKTEQWCKEIDKEYAALRAAQDAQAPIVKPEPRWKTFLRCLLWWLP